MFVCHALLAIVYWSAKALGLQLNTAGDIQNPMCSSQDTCINSLVICILVKSVSFVMRPVLLTCLLLTFVLFRQSELETRYSSGMVDVEKCRDWFPSYSSSRFPALLELG